MTYKERLIAKRMIDLKELADEYSVKINVKGSKAAAVDKILQKIDEVLHQEFSEETVENIKAELDQGITLAAAIDNARAAKSVKPTKKIPAVRKSKKIKELTYNNKTQSIKAWAEELQLPYHTLYDRINRNGWSIEEAIEIPLGKRR